MAEWLCNWRQAGTDESESPARLSFSQDEHMDNDALEQVS
jgi:hypothetical protein